MLKRTILIAACAAAFFATIARAEPADKDPVATVYRDALLAQLDKLEAALPELTKSAEAAADKLIAGGNFYAGGQEGFVTEAYDRAGGFMMLLPLEERKLTDKDVLLVGAYSEDDAAAMTALRRAKEAGSYVVLFSPAFKDAASPVAGMCNAHVINYSLPEGLPVPGAAEAKRNLPTSACYDVTALWTWTGELIGACTRKGKTPVLFNSVAVPGGRGRNAPFFQRGRNRGTTLHFHATSVVPPQKAGDLGKAYLDVTRRQVRGFRGATLGQQLSDIGLLMADAVVSGAMVRTVTLGHFSVFEAQSARIPKWMHPYGQGVGLDELEQMEPGDVFFESGYTDLDTPYVEAARKAGAKSVIALCHAPVAPLDEIHPDYLIDTQWDYGDSSVLLPGYDVKILPASGVAQTVVLWTTIAKAEEELQKGY